MSAVGWVVLILIVFLFVSINAWLVALLRGKNTDQASNMWKKASQRMKNPWEVEDRSLSELSQLVSRLKSKSESDEKISKPK